MKGKLKVNGFWQPYLITKSGNEYILSFDLLNFPNVYGKSEANVMQNAKLQLEAKGYRVTEKELDGDGC
jgi:hypothetical protein